MSLYSALAWPMLKQLDAETAHEHALSALELAQGNAMGRALLRQLAGWVPSMPVRAMGLVFPNPLGIAAGFDKDARVVPGLEALGFGHVEVGTLTPAPQPGNDRPRIFRLPPDRALINRMGFPNHGIEAAAKRLAPLTIDRHRRIVIGLSLGKQKDTPLEKAADDYAAVLRAGAAGCDYYAVNISSPNTAGLRDLQGARYLGELLRHLDDTRDAVTREGIAPRRPLLVKIAPDIDDAGLDAILGACLDNHIDGLIATNTTLARDGLQSLNASEKGGLSGAPLALRSTYLIAQIRQRIGDRMVIIGAGGIFTAEDARHKLDAGATLLQVYTGLVYEGPGMAGRVLRGLASVRA